MLSALSVAQMFLQLRGSPQKCQKGTAVGVTLGPCPNSLRCGRHVGVTAVSRWGGATAPRGLPRPFRAPPPCWLPPLSPPSPWLLWVHQDSSFVLVLGVLLFAHGCPFPV